MSRTFEHKPAIRERVWLRIAIAGPTGAGKSMSAQQLNLGFSMVDEAPVWLVNTEGPNGLLYAPKPGNKANPPTTFNFVHLPFDPPHRTPDYLAAVRYAVDNGARHIIIDGGHFEHEAYLAYHESEVTRLVGRNDTYERRNAMAMTGWIKPSAERHAALLAFRTIPANITWCFQGKEKVHIKKKLEMKDSEDRMVEMGWQPIAGSEVVAELPIRFLLPPGSDGVPNLRPDMPGEKLFSRVPIELRQPGFLTPGRALDVELGKKLQEWAMESSVPAVVDPVFASRQEFMDAIRTALTEQAPGSEKALFKKFFGKPWSEAASIPVPRLSSGLAALRAERPIQDITYPPIALPGPILGQPGAPGDHRERVLAAAKLAGIPEERIASVIGGPLADLPADLEGLAMDNISNFEKENPK